MKLTQKTLKKMIVEMFDKYEPGEMTPITQFDIDKPDVMEPVFKIMDEVVDKAIEMLGTTEEDYMDVEAHLTPLSNEVVTARLRDIDGMAQELVERYKAMKEKGQYHPGAL